MKKTLAIFFLLSLFTVSAFAQGSGGNNDGNDVTGGNTTGNEVTGGNTISIENPIGASTVQELLGTVLRAIVQISVPFLVLAVMYVGFLFVLARGNPEKLAQARQALFYTLLGALIILGAQTLAIILGNTINELTTQD